MGMFKDRSDYFKRLANLNKQVQHDRVVNGQLRNAYHRINDYEELISACVNWAHFPCVAHVGFEGRYTGHKDAIPKRKITNGLVFLVKASMTDMTARETAFDTAFAIMEEFISKMYVEHLAGCSIFKNLDLSRCGFGMEGPIGEGLFGFSMSFEDENFASSILEFDETKWHEEEE